MHVLWKLSVVALLFALSGCGDFVRYDEDSALGQGGDDVKPRFAFPMAARSRAGPRTSIGTQIAASSSWQRNRNGPASS